MLTVVDLVPLLKDTKMAPGVELPKAILEAHNMSGNAFAHQWSGVEGWFPSKCIPPVKTFFKVAHGVVFACIQTKWPEYIEKRVGRIENGQIQMETQI